MQEESVYEEKIKLEQKKKKSTNNGEFFNGN